MHDSQTCIGRFAPSPTGPLHFGSLYTALASFLHTRSQQGLWRLRIDDLDTPRNVNGSDTSILTTLEAFGLEWDGEVYYQSQHLDDYEQALNVLRQHDCLYPCTCSRSMLTTTIYPGKCRHKHFPEHAPHALRVKTDQRVIRFVDALQGEMTYPLDQQGDFILKRKDGIIAYQFAVVLDDYSQQVNEVVRGFDLLESTPRQIYLQQILGLPTPRYWHVPIIVDAQGFKLSKQTLATAVDVNAPATVLFELLSLLKQNPPLELRNAAVVELLDWGIAHWNPAALKTLQSLSRSPV